MKNKSTASLLCLFLGGIGAHHYYLGNTGRGLIYSLFALTFIPSFIALIEFIGFATMSENEFHLRHNAAYIDHGDPDEAIMNKLGQLNNLRVSGALTEEEFQEKKRKLIA